MKIDARGLSCPQPLVMTMKALDEKQNNSEILEVLVDNVVSVENITRYATHNNLKVSSEKTETDDYSIKIRR